MDSLERISEETLKKVLPKLSDEIKYYLPEKPEILLKYAERSKPPKIHSDLTEETKKMMIDNVLSDEEYLLTFFSIMADTFREKTKSKNPKLFLVIGQTGSGKSNLTAGILKENKNCIVLDSDKYKSYRPDAETIARKNPNAYGYLTAIDSYEHRDNVYKYALNNGYNIIMEKAPDIKKGMINVDIEEAISKGYEIIVKVLAVGNLNSALSIHERYEGQIEAGLQTPKLTSLSRHNQSFEGLNKTVKKMQKDRNIKIIVYKRANLIYESPTLVYPMENCNIYSSPYEALINTQTEDNRKIMTKFDARYELIKKQMDKRMAEESHYQQLEDVKEMYLKVLDKENVK